MDELIKKAAEDLSGAKMVTALTGAGISVESGIPPFRGKRFYKIPQKPGTFSLRT
jgi:NAD-dependent deacetylase